MARKRLLGLGVLLAVAFIASHGPSPDSPKRVEALPPIASPEAGAPEQPSKAIAPPIQKNIADSSKSTQPAPLFSMQSRTGYVGPSKLRVRVRPGPNETPVGMLVRNQAVDILETNGGWSHIKSRDGKIEGWVSSNFLARTPSVSKPRPAIAPVQQPKQVTPVKKPQVSRAIIVQRIIAESLASYPGNCPCPEYRDRAGRRCGKRSAWYRAGGYAPLCYPSDVTEDMISKWSEANQ